MSIIGIDLGTTNSIVTAFVDGESVLIPNSQGEILTPSVISMNDSGEIIVGQAAKERLISTPNFSAALFKRKMGTDDKIKLGKKSFLPEELSSFLLRQLIQDAEKFLGQVVTEVVISVPAYFNANQRAATKMAGTLSGVKVERLINEPSAAALACRQDGVDETFIVFDFGGGTLDVSIVETFDTIINICAISGNNFLGGTDFDEAIAEAACEANDLDLDKLSVQDFRILLKAAEMAKIHLSTHDTAEIFANLGGQEIKFALTETSLESISQKVLQRLKAPIQAAVRDSGLAISDIDKCILIGGSCNMPIVQNFLGGLLRVPVVSGEDMDKAVAYGLGAYVGIKQRASEVKDLVLTDICPFSLNIAVHNFQDPTRLINSAMIPRNTALPASRTSPFFTVNYGQTELNLQINQGEELYAADNTQLGGITVKVPRNMKEFEKADVTFIYDINAILVVQVKPPIGEVKQLVLTGKGLEIPKHQIEKYLQNIQDMKLAHHERIELLTERAKRIYTESSEFQKLSMQQVVLELEGLVAAGSIRKTNIALDEIEAFLNEIEGSMSANDIFNDMPVFMRLIKGGLQEDSDE
jgi:molecular chaperone HscC